MMPTCRSLRTHASVAAILLGAFLAVQARAESPASPAAPGSNASSRANIQHARLNSTIALTVASAAGGNGSSVMLVATVDGSSHAAPGGSVVFTIQGKAFGEAPVANGSASLILKALPNGLSSLAASYNGDENFLPSKSAPVRFYNDDQD